MNSIYLPLFQKNESWRKVLGNVDVAAMAGDPQEKDLAQKVVLGCPRHNTPFGSLGTYDVSSANFRFTRPMCSAPCGVVCPRGKKKKRGGGGVCVCGGGLDYKRKENTKKC